jgi:putative peptidoglycan lipid II flippase
VLLALTIPAAVLLAIAVGPLIRAAFDFSESGTALVTWVTRMFLLGIVGHSVLEVAARGFYSQQDARRPLLASALTTLAYAVFGLLLSRSLGAVGLSLANTLAYTGEAVLLLIWLRPRLAGTFRLEGTPWRTALGTLVGGGITALVLWILTGSNSEPGAVTAALALAAGGLIAIPFIRSELRVLIRL